MDSRLSELAERCRAKLDALPTYAQPTWYRLLTERQGRA